MRQGLIWRHCLVGFAFCEDRPTKRLEKKGSLFDGL